MELIMNKKKLSIRSDSNILEQKDLFIYLHVSTI